MEAKSWAIELWDQVEELLRHSNDQIETLDGTAKLFLEIQKLQSDFGRRVKKVVQEYQAKKKPPGDKFTLNTAISDVLQQLFEMGNIYENCAKDVGERVVNGLKSLIEHDRREFEKQKAECIKLNNDLEHLHKLIEMGWRAYVSAFRERQKAHEKSIEANKDNTLARNEQIKFEDIYKSKAQAFEQLTTNYASVLNKYNQGHRKHFTRMLVEFLDQLEMAEQYRGTKVKELFTQSGQLHEDAARKMNESCRATKEAAARIDTINDSSTLIERLSTGFLHPVDLPFLNLDKCPLKILNGSSKNLANFMLGCASSGETVENPRSVPAPGSVTGMLGNLRRTNQSRAYKDDSKALRTPFVYGIGLNPVKPQDLTIIQLSDRLTELRQQQEQTDREIQGTKCLLEACQGNPRLGDADKVMPKTTVLIRRLNSVNQQINKLEELYNRLGGDHALSVTQSSLEQMGSQTNNALPPGGGNSGEVRDFDEDFDSDGDEPAGSTTGSSTLPGAVIRDPQRSRSSAYVGYATVKYDYEGNGPNYLASKTGELFYVLELDSENTGWTTVVSGDGSRQGFLPTGYLDLSLY